MSDEINIKFLILSNGNETIVKCHKKEKLNNVLNNFCKKKGINLDLDYIYFLCNGSILDKHDTTITIDNMILKNDYDITILVYSPYVIKINFSHVNDVYKVEINVLKELSIDEIFNKYLLEKKINRNNIILKYKNKQINLSQTLIQFISEQNIKLNKADDNIEIKFDVVDYNSQIYNSFHINTQANIPYYSNQYNAQVNNNSFYINQINELKRQLNEEKSKNQILFQKNTELNNIINNLKNNITNYEKKIKLLEKEIKNYKSDINSLNNSTNSIKYLRPGERILTVNFVSMGFQEIGHYSLACKNTDRFIKLEEKLNDDFKQLNNYETYFMVNGQRIKRFKTLDENNIKSNDIVSIFLIDV